MFQLILFLAGAITAQQGQAFRLSVPHEPGVQTVEVQWQDKKVPYVQVGNEWIAVIGVDLEVKPGDYPAQVEILKNGAVQRETVNVTIRSVAFPTEKVTVAEQFVQLSQANQERANREALEIAEIHNTITKEMLWREPFGVPIEGRVGSNFGFRRVFNNEPRSPHTGADLRATTGTRIHSANRGRVALAKDLFYTGNTVMIDHGLGIITLYAHLSRIDVKKGDIAERGQLLGLAGATGRASGPHLHWGARVQNARVNPFSLVEIGK